MLNIRHDLLKKPLELKKTHDFCLSGKPELTIVFLHGIASDSSSFKNTLKYLEGTTSLKNVRFVTYDLLGSGKSYKNNKMNYDYDDQLTALENSLSKLKIDTPLIIVGHSMGTLIATKYATNNKKAVQKLILCSPPIYTETDLDNPAFSIAMEGFKKIVSAKNHSIVKEKSFINSIEKIVKDRKNYKRLAELTVPTIIIYGDEDQIIASYNIPGVIKANKYLTAIKTAGKHSMSREKYTKIKEILEEMLYGN